MGGKVEISNKNIFAQSFRKSEVSLSLRCGEIFALVVDHLISLPSLSSCPGAGNDGHGGMKLTLIPFKLI